MNDTNDTNDTNKASDKKQTEFINVSTLQDPNPLQKGFDPEMLYVECSRCGAPVFLEPGRCTELLQSIGIDPLELDPSCLLLTNACPLCGKGHTFKVRIIRLSEVPLTSLPRNMGTA